MSERWRRLPLGEVAQFQRGFDLPSKDRRPGNVPIVSSSGISGWHDQFMACGPGIVTGRYGTIGELYYQEGEYWPLNTALWVRNFFSNDPRFVYYLLSAFDFKKFSDKTGVPGVNRNDLHAVQVLRPPLPEQRRIAEILSTWDRAIETVEALIANARAQKKALMRTLLTGKRRLPGFSEAWNETPIAQMGRVVAGGTPDTANPDYWGGSIAWATPTDVTKLSNRYIYTTERALTHHGLSSSAATMVPKNSVVVCTRASVGALAIAGVALATNQGFKSIVPTSGFDHEFIYYLLAHEKPTLQRAAGGSTFAEISKSDFERLRFLVPSLGEQRGIAAAISAADEQLATRKLEQRMLRQEKAALMQQLLTGKRRVKIAEDIAA